MKFLDKLVHVQDHLWIEGNLVIHKYQEERRTAKIVVNHSDHHQIRLQLVSDKDPKLYDEPLTLLTPVHKLWKKCLVSQKDREQTITVINNEVHYSGIPGWGEITISKIDSK